MAEVFELEVCELNLECSGVDVIVIDVECILFIMGVVVVFVLWIIIFLVVNMLLIVMIEEKGNKVFEMMMFVMCYYEILIGKLFGVVCVFVILFVFWMGFVLGGVILV